MTGRDITSFFHGQGIPELTAEAVSGAAEFSGWTRLSALVLTAYALFLASRAFVKVVNIAYALVWDVPRTRLARANRSALAFIGLLTLFLALSLAIVTLREYSTIGEVISLLLYTVGLFAMGWYVSWWLPHRECPLIALAPGAVLFAVLLEVLHVVTVVWLPHHLESKSQQYGTIGIAIGLLLWAYLLGRVITLAAVLNAALWSRFGSDSAHPIQLRRRRRARTAHRRQVRSHLDSGLRRRPAKHDRTTAQRQHHRIWLGTLMAASGEGTKPGPSPRRQRLLQWILIVRAALVLALGVAFVAIGHDRHILGNLLAGFWLVGAVLTLVWVRGNKRHPGSRLALIAGSLGIVAAVIGLSRALIEHVISANAALAVLGVSAVLVGTLRIVGGFRDDSSGRSRPARRILLGAGEVLIGVVWIVTDEVTRTVKTAVGVWALLAGSVMLIDAMSARRPRDKATRTTASGDEPS